MKLAILHLSDIHFGDGENPVSTRADRIRRAVQSAGHKLDACFIALTGDIAFSGAKSQYTQAHKFLVDLITGIRSIPDLNQCQCVMVPGNHDCDFDNESDIRGTLLDTMKDHVADLRAGSDRVLKCVEIQNEFFRFQSRFNAKNYELPLDERLHYKQEFQIDGRSVRFNCYNTAWVSRKEELPGTLLYPVQIAADENESYDADLTVSLMHHPYGWLNPDNSNLLKKWLNQTSDVILTGHEHRQDAYYKKYLPADSGAEVFHTEGAALQQERHDQDPDSPSSGFNILVIDLSNRRQKTIAYHWDRDKYLPRSEPSWLPSVRNRALRLSQFENNSGFTSLLRDVGAGFTHPRKREQLQLPDIFVYPDLSHRSLDEEEAKAKQTLIRSEEVFDRIAKEKCVLIIGAEDSGKTSLAKSLYLDFQARKSGVPVLMFGNELDGPDSDDFENAVNRAFASQYSRELVNDYKQLDLARRCPRNS
ncbi:MAG: metallophosphoesterase family protein [Acidobacteriota bacterium]